MLQMDEIFQSGVPEQCISIVVFTVAADMFVTQIDIHHRTATGKRAPTVMS